MHFGYFLYIIDRIIDENNNLIVKDIANNIVMLQSGRTTTDLFRTSKFPVLLVPGPAI